MRLNRRQMLAACAGGIATAAGTTGEAATLGRDEPTSLGVVIHSFPQRSADDRERGAKEPIEKPSVFLEHVHALGGKGVQLRLDRDWKDADEFAEKVGKYEMYVEGIVSLPRNQTHLDEFQSQSERAYNFGASIVRTVLLEGRRYETFTSAAAFRRRADEAFESLRLALSRLFPGQRLAVENHKDFRADQLVAMLKRLDSDRVGVCLDTGNSIALLEDPMEVVETLAPWAFTTHLKDMAVREDDDGFQLAEVPFGEGFLDLKRIVRVLKSARPEICFNVEMITRDPLEVPCLTDRYWAASDDISTRDLARALRGIRRHASKDPLPKVSGRPREERLRLEEENVGKCLAYARAQLGL